MVSNKSRTTVYTPVKIQTYINIVRNNDGAIVCALNSKLFSYGSTYKHTVINNPYCTKQKHQQKHHTNREPYC